ncbi:hypothetical protein predicted by Glimmer/Critica [Acetobacter senegalensis]|uniref:Uncharacterized protein n=1 Tax=Acetobacter senegalensis TaxID=446692 RepID=A0A0U5EYQ4_9PROT|nr:hypothetical protein predicted by Glimmer/Critica [Acetobacter senegalensis]
MTFDGGIESHKHYGNWISWIRDVPWGQSHLVFFS